MASCVRWREGASCIQGNEKISGTHTECFPFEVVEKRNNLWVTPFFAFLIPFASFPSQESINILDRETAAFINSRRRERSRFCSFLSFWSRCEPFSPLAAYIRQTKRQIQRLKQKYLGALFLCALLLLC